ncbi:hypothetical protein JRQ81_004807 [Phrynocephalus forsythii]|uniref:Uncharacterized protein n=1 Tax=Phrynocephalus forsythii TaxID=171643 RepID=A0A9Q1AVH0_9SAUR|nr:hypothetical protein JRQ81_004807 [Phrynocephalus forsythii]
MLRGRATSSAAATATVITGGRVSGSSEASSSIIAEKLRWPGITDVQWRSILEEEEEVEEEEEEERRHPGVLRNMHVCCPGMSCVCVCLNRFIRPEGSPGDSAAFSGLSFSEKKSDDGEPQQGAIELTGVSPESRDPEDGKAEGKTKKALY